ncbi:hypothetical protein [Alishewanella sp. SMS8]|uniref:hypothetical protein n=1 Tax=Alishewanella sp. SMS8 TaxID=2994676 RepID=UPI0027416D57|nr:hypothetical protein [Alishewanella sp. SMS8]MDP5459865.1 hypothetical protein [Alishewanella sp. SMS8]
MGSFEISFIVYLWVLLLTLLWARNGAPESNRLALLIVAAIVAVIFYVPLIAIWALQLFNLLN